MKVSLLIKNAKQIVTPLVHSGPNPGFELRIIENGAIAVADDRIVAIDPVPLVLDTIDVTAKTQVIDAAGKTVTPGLVDPHTHPIFYETREAEFEMRLSGKSYQEIAQAGGGIRASIRSLRKANKQQLIDVILPRLQLFLENGTTTIEAKSGYGLSVEDEIKSLEVIQELNQCQALELISTFLGAHEVPDEYRENRETYIRMIIDEMIPFISSEKLAEFIDVFCEEGVFNVEEARRVLLAGQQHGLKAKIHANQLTPGAGARLAAEVNAISAEHLDYVTETDIAMLREAGVVPVLLPGAVFFLNLDHYAPARAMIEAGLPIALSTDFNPGTSMTESLPLIMTLACLKLGLTPAEALVASTIHAARAIHRENLIGSLELNKQADIVIWNMPNYRHLTYHFGVQQAEIVIKKGKVCYKKSH